MSEFKLFEVTSHNDVEISTTHTVEEVFSANGKCGETLINYFYNLDGSQLKFNFNESRYYVTLTGAELWDLIRTLGFCIEYVNSYGWLLFRVFINMGDVEYLFSDDFINDMKNLHKDLVDVLPSGSVSNRERLFLYNIMW